MRKLKRRFVQTPPLVPLQRLWSRCSECSRWEEDCLCWVCGSDSFRCHDLRCDYCKYCDYFYRCGERKLNEDAMYDTLLWVQEARPWLTHGSNPILDLLEELALPERPAHGWTEDVVKQFYFNPGKEPQIDQPQT